MHRGQLTVHADKTTSGQSFSGSIDQLLYLVRHISQVFTICPSINVDYRSDIIVILNRRRARARNRGDIGHNLGLSRITPKNWQVAQIIQGMQIILRCLGVDLITNSVARIDPEVWGSLSRSYSVADATERPTLGLPCERTYLRIDELGSATGPV